MPDSTDPGDVRARQLFAIAGEIREMFFRYSPLPELNPSQFQMMRLIWQMENGCLFHGIGAPADDPQPGAKITELARRMRNAAPTVSQRADELETMGYVERRRSSADRRAVYLTLTPRGNALMRRSMQLYDHLGRRLVARLGDEEFDRFLETLNNLKNALAAEEADFSEELARGKDTGAQAAEKEKNQ